MAGAALGRRGGIPVRGGSHVRGGGPPGMPANGYMASSRGRGGSMAWGGRGRGGGGVGGFGGAPSGVDDPPPRSLARKVDAGGNAVMPDLIAVPSASEGGVDPSRSQTVGEEPEEGEREEGEMDETAPEEQGELGQPEAPDETAYPQAAPTGSIHPTQRPLHLGSLPGRQSYSQQAPSESGGASDSATPLTPAMPATTTPSISSAVGQNPYSSAAWQNPATSTPNPTQTPARSAAPKTVPTYTAAHFSKSVQPEWDAELWTLSAHRLAAISQHPISTNFHVSLQDPPTTPGLSGVPSSIVSGLRTALADLKEATTELEMSSIRSRECERSRAEAAQM
ncbi:hypothetical protein BCV69DRAFT_275692 [Microstroma glucosiphilum]|uniref:Uncharacterized protein n=1 Tax=Pseudomicrostroma glucosiphilum TaxID=1684307 RepID=A0A316UCA2_9BASI|nr:hypothetical protein BCV69DRAFT_275692 [Pseudomicrostroma glucosiphilum]PWN22782.1 hypothetical protein BCV69DRAFT_275692 [Pseudomicrostroma glucosiphilum]